MRLTMVYLVMFAMFRHNGLGVVQPIWETRVQWVCVLECRPMTVDSEKSIRESVSLPPIPRAKLYPALFPPTSPHMITI